MSKGNGDSLNTLQVAELMEQVMHDAEIASFVDKNIYIKPRTEKAIEWLITENPGASPDEIVKAIRRVRQPLLTDKLSVFFSYKAKDKEIAKKIAKWLEEWSAGKLEIEHMARLGFDQVGLDWRKKIEETIPKCDLFLLLPNPGEEGN